MNNLTKRILSSLFLIPFSFYFITQGSYMLIFFLLICLSISIFEWNMMAQNKTYKIFGFFFLIFSFYSFYKLSSELLLVFFIILICISTDIGGYLFGKIFKGPKLTKISPNKTYAGMMGGYFLSLLNLTFIIYIVDYSKLSVQLYVFIFLISSVSQLGDIIISYFKRLSKIKDTGIIIPGHGGLLDRIDGMIFTFPIIFLIDMSGNLNL